MTLYDKSKKTRISSGLLLFRKVRLPTEPVRLMRPWLPDVLAMHQVLHLQEPGSFPIQHLRIRLDLLRCRNRADKPDPNHEPSAIVNERLRSKTFRFFSLLFGLLRLAYFYRPFLSTLLEPSG